MCSKVPASKTVNAPAAEILSDQGLTADSLRFFMTTSVNQSLLVDKRQLVINKSNLRAG